MALSLTIGTSFAITGCSLGSALDSADSGEVVNTEEILDANENTLVDSTAEDTAVAEVVEEAAAPRRLAVVDESESVLAIISDHPDLTTFAELVSNFPYKQVFTQARGVTIFAPSNAAFESMTAEEIQALSDDSSAFTLFLSAHMTIGTYPLGSVTGSGSFTNAMAQTIPVDQLTIAESDLAAANGIIHVVDSTIDQ